MTLLEGFKKNKERTVRRIASLKRMGNNADNSRDMCGLQFDLSFIERRISILELEEKY